jgi:hypothetical protein
MFLACSFGPLLDCYLPESATNVSYICFEDQETMNSVLSLGQHYVDGVCVHVRSLFSKFNFPKFLVLFFSCLLLQLGFNRLIFIFLLIF